jgi:hypothetical protein
MTNTNEITTETPASICIGSDQYAAQILRVTPFTVTAKIAREDEKPMIFRLNRFGSWRSGNFRLSLGKSETILDPCF